MHRDIKPENILVADDVLKLADFGSCRGIYSKQPYTEYISTRWCVQYTHTHTRAHTHTHTHTLDKIPRARVLIDRRILNPKP